MSEEGTMGTLILLQRVREEAARAALAAAQAQEDQARGEERDAEERRRRAAEAVEAARRGPPVGQASPPAQVLHLADLRRRRVQEALVAIEVQVALLQGRRVTAEQVRERRRAEWEAARARREKLEERLRAARAAARRRRAQAAERARDDLPPRGEGDG